MKAQADAQAAEEPDAGDEDRDGPRRDVGRGEEAAGVHEDQSADDGAVDLMHAQAGHAPGYLIPTVTRVRPSMSSAASSA